MNSGVNSPLVKCPLMLALNERGILCESHVPGGKCIEIRFETKQMRDIQKTCFCQGAYDHCEQYRSYMHFNAWDDDGKEDG